MLNATNYETLKMHALVAKLTKDRTIVQNEIARIYQEGTEEDLTVLFDRDLQLADKIDMAMRGLTRQTFIKA